jgi:hypothetical protein
MHKQGTLSGNRSRMGRERMTPLLIVVGGVSLVCYSPMTRGKSPGSKFSLC